MRLVLGGAQIGHPYGVARRSSTDSQLASLILDEAQQLGFDALDTAPGYGKSEELIGLNWRGEIHTKIDPSCDPLDSIIRSLSFLRRERVEVLYFHDWRVLRSPATLSRVSKEMVPRFADELGVSIYEREDFLRFLELDDLSVVQLPMSVIDQRLVDVVWNNSDRSKRVFVRSILFRGLLGENGNRLENTELQPQLADLRQIAARNELSLEELSIRWVSSAPGVSGIVLGVDSINQLRDCERFFRKGPLEESVLEAIFAVRKPRSELVDLRRW